MVWSQSRLVERIEAKRPDLFLPPAHHVLVSFPSFVEWGEGALPCLGALTVVRTGRVLDEKALTRVGEGYSDAGHWPIFSHSPPVSRRVSHGSLVLDAQVPLNFLFFPASMSSLFIQ